MRRTALIVACLALPLAPPASAEPVPAPTLTISVEASGQPLPESTTTARWIVGGAGQQAELDVDAYNLPGMVTTIDAVWTSREVTVHPRIPAFEYEVTTSHEGPPASSLPASFSYGLRYREAGGRWTRWYDLAQAYEAGNPVQGVFREAAVGFASDRKKRVQLQFRVHTEIADASKEHQVWKLLANI